MESDKTQQMVFVSEVLPSLFHDTPEQSIRLLARDGTKHLRFFGMRPASVWGEDDPAPAEA